jgi:vancomycin resistance protein VanW
MTVIERSTHSFDPFPDDGRTIPWGVGVTIVGNYLDLAVRNDTDHTFRLTCAVGQTHLHGALSGDTLPEHTYRVFAHDETFLRHAGRIYRRNQIRRTVTDRHTGQDVGEALVRRNLALVAYRPAAGVTVHDL